jgi:hypothetical protein
MPYKIRLTALLSKGYFPKELPATSTTEDFGNSAVEIISDWQRDRVFSVEQNLKNKKIPLRGAYKYKINQSAELEVISTPKRGFERRNIHVVHPLFQSLICLEISKNWRSVQKWLSRQTYSLDEIRIGSNFPRAIKGINFQVHSAKKAFIEGTSDWVVKTDIARFYPTIYTHSIPWAAYGKDNVKKEINIYNGSLADRLDVLIRGCNRNQTVGIPIGPETSRIVAEAISSRIDQEFSGIISDLRKIPNLRRERTDRLQDDWFVGVQRLEDAEFVLSAISEAYREFGLEINGSKTSIDRVLETPGSRWIGEIGAFLSHRPGPIRGARLRELLALCLRLQINFANEPIIAYVLSVVEGSPIANDDVEAVESFLLKAAIVSPGAMDRICRILINIQYNTKRISKARIQERFTKLAERNIDNGNVYEALWQLYTLRGLRMSLDSSSICERMEKIPSSVLALVLLDMKSRGLCVRKLPQTEWENQFSKNSILSDWSWLLAYEGIRHGWLSDRSKVMREPFFRAMLARNVVFYDEQRNVRPSYSVTQIARRQRNLNVTVARNMLQRIRGIDNLY